jgi:predicted nucleic acid-binding protein
VAKVFLDTNVLAYQFDGSEPDKQAHVRALLSQDAHAFAISTQVLLELYQVITRKLTPPVPASVARQVLATLAELPVVSADSRLVLRAAQTAEAAQVSIWDAMIVEAAADAGCDVVWTEDLHSGASLRGVAIVNPFAPAT